MTAIGSGNIGALNLVGSFAGAQRNNATANEASAQAAEKAFQIDAARLTAQTNGDVSETELSSERDADGRMPYEQEHPQSEKQNEEAANLNALRRSSDAAGELGNSLDLQA